MKYKLLTIQLTFLMFIILLSTTVLADYHTINETKRKDFNARLEHIDCRIKLTEKQIDLLSSLDDSITSYKTILDADYAKLQELANALNHKEFNQYITKTFRDNLKNAAEAIRDVKRDVRKSNLTREERISLRDIHKTAIAEFADCIDKADKDWAERRAEYLNSWFNRWNNIISKMKEKGYDTSDMEGVVADAQNKLVPIIEEIKNAGTKEARKTAMQNARDLHLHLWARFEIARISSYLKSIEDDAIAKGYQADVDAVKAKLEEASNFAVAGKKYKEGEFKTVWIVIKDTSKILKELNKKLKE